MSNYYSQLPPDQNRWWNTFFTVLAILGAGSLFVLALIFSGCSAERKITAAMVKHPDAGLKVCAAMFPPKKEIVTNTETKTIEGPTVYHYDTVQADCDTVFKIGGKRIVRIPCPPSTHRIDSVFTTTTVTITKTDEKQVTLLQKELTVSKSDADDLRKGRNKWRWIALAGIVIIAGGLVFKFMGKINPFKKAA